MSAVVAVAVVRDDPPRVFIAEDQETLNWVLALQLVARTRPADLDSSSTERLRTALLEEQWGEAVTIWMERFGRDVDVYPSEDLYERADVEMGPDELQFSPLFRD
jgi:hypothetical protein